MKSLPRIFVLLLCFQILIVSCTSDESEVPEPLAAATFINVSYGASEQQVYDLYLPEGRTSEKTKVLILVHGGGWTSGDKADMAYFVSLIQLRHPNHAIVNINYVLATATIPAFPNQFLDLKAVIDKITAEKTELAILPEFGLIGVSAGAHIALQYDYVYDAIDAVKMVCDIVGPTDFTDPFYADNPDFPFLLSLLVDESAYPVGTNYTEAVSPALQVTEDSSPSILFYGNMDPLVPLSNGETLEAALSEAMVTHSFTVYKGGHGNDWSEASMLDLQQQLTAFINTHLAVQ